MGEGPPYSPPTTDAEAVTPARRPIAEKTLEQLELWRARYEDIRKDTRASSGPEFAALAEAYADFAHRAQELVDHPELGDEMSVLEALIDAYKKTEARFAAFETVYEMRRDVLEEYEKRKKGIASMQASDARRQEWYQANSQVLSRQLNILREWVAEETTSDLDTVQARIDAEALSLAEAVETLPDLATPLDGIERGADHESVVERAANARQTSEPGPEFIKAEKVQTGGSHGLGSGIVTDAVFEIIRDEGAYEAIESPTSGQTGDLTGEKEAELTAQTHRESVAALKVFGQEPPAESDVLNRARVVLAEHAGRQEADTALADRVATLEKLQKERTAGGRPTPELEGAIAIVEDMIEERLKEIAHGTQEGKEYWAESGVVGFGDTLEGSETPAPLEQQPPQEKRESEPTATDVQPGAAPAERANLDAASAQVSAQPEGDVEGATQVVPGEGETAPTDATTPPSAETAAAPTQPEGGQVSERQAVKEQYTNYRSELRAVEKEYLEALSEQTNAKRAISILRGNLPREARQLREREADKRVEEVRARYEVVLNEAEEKRKERMAQAIDRLASGRRRRANEDTVDSNERSAESRQQRFMALHEALLMRQTATMIELAKGIGGKVDMNAAIAKRVGLMDMEGKIRAFDYDKDAKKEDGTPLRTTEEMAAVVERRKQEWQAYEKMAGGRKDPSKLINAYKDVMGYYNRLSFKQKLAIRTVIGAGVGAFSGGIGAAALAGTRAAAGFAGGALWMFGVTGLGHKGAEKFTKKRTKNLINERQGTLAERQAKYLGYRQTERNLKRGATAVGAAGAFVAGAEVGEAASQSASALQGGDFTYDPLALPGTTRALEAMGQRVEFGFDKVKEVFTGSDTLDGAAIRASLVPRPPAVQESGAPSSGPEAPEAAPTQVPLPETEGAAVEPRAVEETINALRLAYPRAESVAIVSDPGGRQYIVVRDPTMKGGGWRLPIEERGQAVPVEPNRTADEAPRSEPALEETPPKPGVPPEVAPRTPLFTTEVPTVTKELSVFKGLEQYVDEHLSGYDVTLKPRLVDELYKILADRDAARLTESGLVAEEVRGVKLPAAPREGAYSLSFTEEEVRGAYERATSAQSSVQSGPKVEAPPETRSPEVSRVNNLGEPVLTNGLERWPDGRVEGVFMEKNVFGGINRITETIYSDLPRHLADQAGVELQKILLERSSAELAKAGLAVDQGSPDRAVFVAIPSKGFMLSFTAEELLRAREAVATNILTGTYERGSSVTREIDQWLAKNRPELTPAERGKVAYRLALDEVAQSKGDAAARRGLNYVGENPDLVRAGARYRIELEASQIDKHVAAVRAAGTPPEPGPTRDIPERTSPSVQEPGVRSRSFEERFSGRSADHPYVAEPSTGDVGAAIEEMTRAGVPLDRAFRSELAWLMKEGGLEQRLKPELRPVFRSLLGNPEVLKSIKLSEIANRELGDASYTVAGNRVPLDTRVEAALSSAYSTMVKDLASDNPIITNRTATFGELVREAYRVRALPVEPAGDGSAARDVKPGANPTPVSDIRRENSPGTPPAVARVRGESGGALVRESAARHPGSGDGGWEEAANREVDRARAVARDEQAYAWRVAEDAGWEGRRVGYRRGGYYSGRGRYEPGPLARVRAEGVVRAEGRVRIPPVGGEEVSVPVGGEASVRVDTSAFRNNNRVRWINPYYREPGSVRVRGQIGGDTQVYKRGGYNPYGPGPNVPRGWRRVG